MAKKIVCKIQPLGRFWTEPQIHNIYQSLVNLKPCMPEKNIYKAAYSENNFEINAMYNAKTDCFFIEYISSEQNIHEQVLFQGGNIFAYSGSFKGIIKELKQVEHIPPNIERLRHKVEPSINDLIEREETKHKTRPNKKSPP